MVQGSLSSVTGQMSIAVHPEESSSSPSQRQQPPLASASQGSSSGRLASSQGRREQKKGAGASANAYKPGIFDSFRGLVYGLNDDAAKFVEGRRLVEAQFKNHQKNVLVKSLQHDSKVVFISKCASSTIMQRDPVGACVFHIAYLHGRYKRGRALVQKFPDECLEPYGVPDGYKGDVSYLPYTGETVLHMVVMQGQLEEASFILDTYSKKDLAQLRQLLDAVVTGHFFTPKEDYEPKKMGVYYGDKALHMAVCCNNIKMVDLLISYYDKLEVPLVDILDLRDVNGNNALHLCVLHNLRPMYDYLLSKFLEPAAAADKKADECMKEVDAADAAKDVASKARDDCDKLRAESKAYKMLASKLENAKNEKLLTPFMLCGMYGKKKMFEYLISRRKEVVWKYGPVTHYFIDLDGFDVPAGYRPHEDESHQSSMFGKMWDSMSGDSANDKPNLGAIEHICAKDRLDMLALDDVKAIIDLKWERVGFWMFLRRACYYMLVTILLSLIVCMYNFQSASTAEGWVTWAYFPAVFILLAAKFITELPEIITRGFSYWGWGDPYVRGAARLDNVCSTIEIVSFGAACILKIMQFFEALSIEQGDVPIRVLVSISVLTSWVYLYFFLLGFTQTGTFVLIVSAILSKDVPVFFTLYVVVLCGFGSSFALLSLHDGGTVADGFGHFFTVLWSLFVYTATGGGYDGFDGKYFPTVEYSAPFWLYVILVAMFNLIILFLMLNLLVAMMSQTYDAIFEQSQRVLYREKYNIMCSMERGLTDAERIALGRSYGTWIIDEATKEHHFYFEMETVKGDSNSEEEEEEKKDESTK